MSKSIFPKQISDMISSRRSRGLKARQIAEQINNSNIAQKLGVKYSCQSIAAKMANLTMDEFKCE